MAQPTVPTLVTITTESLKKAGHTTPTAAQLTRAQDEWMQEVKNDIWTLAKKLTSLQSVYYQPTVKGRSRYSMPTDFSSLLKMALIDGINTSKVAQAATASSLTLNSGETFAEADIQGKFLIITVGTGLGSGTQITAYNSTTKVASVEPNFQTTPAATDSYIIGNINYPLDESPRWDIDGQGYPMKMEKPTRYAPIGDNDDGEFLLYPTPDKVYAAQISYYANLLNIDLAGTLMATLYDRWRNIWTYGVFVKSLENDNNSKFVEANREYKNMLQSLIMREQYGMDISNLQQRVGD